MNAAAIGQMRPSIAIALSLCALVLSACAGELAPPPVVAPPSPPQAAPVQPPEPATPAEVHAAIVRWFSARGYHDFQADALAQHARNESGFRPCAVGAADLRYTYQWGGRRLEQLYEFAHTRSCPRLDWQLAFADHELRTNPNFWCFWRTKTEPAALHALRRGFGLGRC